jgi:hypothetical protein
VTRSMRIVAAPVLAILLAVLTMQASSARADTVEQRARMSGQQAEAEGFDRAVALMEEHMRVARDGTLTLDHKALKRDINDGAARGVQPRTFTKLEEALAHTNAALRANKMEASDVFPSNDIDPSIHKTTFTVMGCRGRNGYEDFWWGRRSYLDDCRTHTLVDVMRAGASICGALPSIQTRLCALLGGVGAIYIDRVDRRGGHDGIYINWSPALRVIYAIRSQ